MFAGLIKRGLNRVHARAKDYTLHKALEAKGIASNKAQKNSEYLMEKGKETG
ncbi:hypothetical protein Bca4012_061868 [Brassica carinata]